jgi:hypothetical protein
LTALQRYEAWPEVSAALGFPLVYDGCSVYYFVSLTESGNPVRLWDGDGWEPGLPEAGVALTVPTLRDWLEGWLSGRDFLDELRVARSE